MHTEFILWFRGSRGRWEPVANGDTYRAALDQIGSGGRRGGAWLILPKGEDANASPRAFASCRSTGDVNR
jgi:hypothetical protein